MSATAYAHTTWRPVRNGAIDTAALDWPMRVRCPRWVRAAEARGERPRVLLDCDLFDERISDEEIAAVYCAMAAIPHWDFVVPSEAADRMRRFGERLTGHANSLRDRVEKSFGFDRALAFEMFFCGARPLPLPNVHLAARFSNQSEADARLPHLLATPAARRLARYDPACGPVDLVRHLSCPTCGGSGWYGGGADYETGESDPGYPCDCTGGGGHSPEPPLDGVIFAGGVGRDAPPCDLAWARSVRDQCWAAGVPLWIERLGSRPMGLFSDYPRPSTWPSFFSRTGSDPAEWPEDLRVRELPGGAR